MFDNTGIGYTMGAPSFRRAANVNFVTFPQIQASSTPDYPEFKESAKKEESMPKGLEGDMRGFYMSKYILRSRENHLVSDISSAIQKAGSYANYARDDNPDYLEHLSQLSQIQYDKVNLDAFKGSLESREKSFMSYMGKVEEAKAMSSKYVDANGMGRQIVDPRTGIKRHMTYGEVLTEMQSEQGYKTSVGEGSFMPKAFDYTDPVNPALIRDAMNFIFSSTLEGGLSGWSRGQYSGLDAKGNPAENELDMVFIKKVAESQKGNSAALRAAVGNLINNTDVDVMRAFRSKYLEYLDNVQMNNVINYKQGQRQIEPTSFNDFLSNEVIQTAKRYLRSDYSYNESPWKAGGLKTQVNPDTYEAYKQQALRLMGDPNAQPMTMNVVEAVYNEDGKQKMNPDGTPVYTVRPFTTKRGVSAVGNNQARNKLYGLDKLLVDASGKSIKMDEKKLMQAPTGLLSPTGYIILDDGNVISKREYLQDMRIVDFTDEYAVMPVFEYASERGDIIQKPAVEEKTVNGEKVYETKIMVGNRVKFLVKATDVDNKWFPNNKSDHITDVFQTNEYGNISLAGRDLRRPGNRVWTQSGLAKRRNDGYYEIYGWMPANPDDVFENVAPGKTGTVSNTIRAQKALEFPGMINQWEQDWDEAAQENREFGIDQY